MDFLLIVLAVVSGALVVGWWLYLRLVKSRNMDIWIGSYVRQSLAPRPRREGPVHVMFAFVDHFEPQWKNPGIDKERERVDRWVHGYPKQAKRFVDADGRHPQHSFFYPEEEYREEHLSKLAEICSQGLGEIEVHLHHDDDTAENFKKTLAEFVDLLHTKHGAFSKHPETGKLSWAFIHGNWTLCNSDEHGRFCGVNDELPILKDLGCYCDMTLPCAPASAQTRTINSIYYASDRPGEPKSHDSGDLVRVGGKESGDLMIIQGALALNWRDRKHGIFPSVEAGDIKAMIPPTKDRTDLWVEAGIGVEGRPDWVFVKVHTHGTQDQDIDALLGKPCDSMYEYLGTKYNDGENYVLHYVSAREMYNIVKAAEAGETGDPNGYRDYLIPKPEYKVA